MGIKWRRIRDKYRRTMTSSTHRRLAKLYHEGKLDFEPSETLKELLKLSTYKAINKPYVGPK